MHRIRGGLPKRQPLRAVRDTPLFSLPTTALHFLLLLFSAFHYHLTGYSQDSSSAVRSGSQPAPLVGRHLLGQKGTRAAPRGRPYGTRPSAVYILYLHRHFPNSRRQTMSYGPVRHHCLLLLFSDFFCLLLSFNKAMHRIPLLQSVLAAPTGGQGHASNLLSINCFSLFFAALFCLLLSFNRLCAGGVTRGIIVSLSLSRRSRI